MLEGPAAAIFAVDIFVMRETRAASTIGTRSRYRPWPSGLNRRASKNSSSPGRTFSRSDSPGCRRWAIAPSVPGWKFSGSLESVSIMSCKSPGAQIGVRIVAAASEAGEWLMIWRMVIGVA